MPADWAAKVRQSLSRTRENLGRQLSGLFGGGKIDAALYEELETILLTADAGVNATAWLLDELRASPYNFNVIIESWPNEQPTVDETAAIEHRWAEEGVAYLRRFIAD